MPEADLASGPLVKRLRTNDDGDYQPTNPAEVRTSSLPSPTMQLSGHKGSVYCLQYNPTGEALASGGFDMKVFLWSHSDYENYNVLEGHKNAVLDLRWLDETHVVTASADKTLLYWDADTGQRLRKFEHSGVVNAVDCDNRQNRHNNHLFVSVGDDSTLKIWDARQKKETASYNGQFQLTSVALNAESNMVYTAGIDNMITAYDIKMGKKVMGLKGHTDTITCLALHPKSSHLLSNSMDNTLRTWDIRPFCAAPQRHCKTLEGAKHNAEKGLIKANWNPDGSMIIAGSADRMLRVFDEFSGEELYLLPGHKGCINTGVFHPKENVIASGASDKMIFVGELGQ